MFNKIFNNKNFLLYWTGQSISGLGTWINFVGLNLYIYKVFGSGKILGVFLVIRMLPAVLFGGLGGYLADRFDRRKIMIVCDTLRAIIVLGFLFTQNLWAFFILGLLLSSIDKIFLSARGSFLPNIVKKEDLLETNAFTQMSYSIVMILGPALGALLVGINFVIIDSFKMIFIIDSVSFLMSVLCISLIAGYEPLPVKKRESTGVFGEFKTTFGFFKGHALLLFLFCLRTVDALSSGSYNTALPIVAKMFKNLLTIPLDTKKGIAYGWLLGAWAGGQFWGSFLAQQTKKYPNLSPKMIFSLSTIIMALGMGLTFRTGDLLYAMIAIFMGGLGDGLSNVIFNTILMTDSPNEIRGKIFGTVVALTVSAVAIGMAVSGYFIDLYPLHRITDISSLIIILSVPLGLFFFSLSGKKPMEETRYKT